MNSIEIKKKDGNTVTINNIICVSFVGDNLIILYHGLFNAINTEFISGTLISSFTVIRKTW